MAIEMPCTMVILTVEYELIEQAEHHLCIFFRLSPDFFFFTHSIHFILLFFFSSLPSACLVL